MKIIITENQLNNKIHQLVKELGWELTCKVLGMTNEELVQKFFNNDPMEFLNLYNDLDVVQSIDHPWTLFRYKPRHNLMIYSKIRNVIYINNKIWSTLRTGFELEYYEAYELVEKWMADEYNLMDIKEILTSIDTDYAYGAI